jgi:hypothetical protein
VCARLAHFVKDPRAMTDQARDWMVAASCCEGPRPAVTFSDLPRAHRDELLRFALVAAASSAFFITVALVMRPLPSRSLTTAAALPHHVPPRGMLLEARDSAAPIPAPQRLRARVVRARVVEEVADESTSPALSQLSGRRGNVFTRLLRGVFRRPAAAGALKADATY